MHKKNTINKANKKPPLVFYIIMFSIPFIFLIGLETGLRYFDYGKNLDAFIKISNDYDKYLFTNPDLPFRYASNMQTPPAVALDGFLKDKQDSTFRIFVMGGSSTAGFPYAYNATFPRYIKRKLQIIYPKVNFEVINLGITAHNSYTVADLADDIINQSPDLVLVYTGHNEYYGILGVASTINFGSSTRINNTIISLNKLKTFQLLNNVINYFKSSLVRNENNPPNSETLMSRMIGESNIPYNSDLFLDGIEQFRFNLNTFLQKMSDNDVDVILSNLTSNLLQKPFTSLVGNINTKEDSLFNEGNNLLKLNDSLGASEAFLMAKEYDGIRFRAPKLLNQKIEDLSAKHNYPMLNIDSAFSSKSKFGIVGYNLMVDHLHPNIEGYNLIGELFTEQIISGEYLSVYDPIKFTETELSLLVESNFAFTRLDSMVSELRIHSLIKKYPFVSQNNSQLNSIIFNPKDFIDSLAFNVVNKNISWRKAHQEAANWFYRNSNYDDFINEMNAIIENQPYAEIAYAQAVSKLINIGRFNDAEKYLIELHKLNPNDYTYKWIGSFALNNGQYEKAIANLQQSSKINSKDPQVYYNLAGAYFNAGNINMAIESAKYCLAINPNYPNAKQFHQSLLQLNKNSN